MNGDNELKNVVEAALLVSEEALVPVKLLALFPEDARPSKEELQRALEQLEQDYHGRGIELRKTGGGYRFWSRDKYSPWLRKLNETRAPRYSRALLETLAIIAYRQPVSRGDIEEIRGVTVSVDIMRVLLNRGWIKELGKRAVPGHPAIYGTTPAFLAYFSLESLSELPQLEEKRDLDAIAAEFSIELPPPQTAAAEGAEGAESAEGAKSSDPESATEAATPLIEEGSMAGAGWVDDADDAPDSKAGDADAAERNDD